MPVANCAQGLPRRGEAHRRAFLDRRMRERDAYSGLCLFSLYKHGLVLRLDRWFLGRTENLV
jgi:hypothetical protein